MGYLCECPLGLASHQFFILTLGFTCGGYGAWSWSCQIIRHLIRKGKHWKICFALIGPAELRPSDLFSWCRDDDVMMMMMKVKVKMMIEYSPGQFLMENRLCLCILDHNITFKFKIQHTQPRCTIINVSICIYPEWHFHILSSPYLHLVVVCSNQFKVSFGDRKEATSKRGSPENKLKIKSVGCRDCIVLFCTWLKLTQTLTVTPI